MVGLTIAEQLNSEGNWRQFRRSQSVDYEDQPVRRQHFQRQYQKRNAGRDDFYGRYSGPSDGTSSAGGGGGGGGDGQNGNAPQSQNDFGE